MTTHDEVISMMEVAILRSVEVASNLSFMTTLDTRQRVQIRNIVLKEMTSDEIRGFIRSMNQQELEFYKMVLEMTAHPLYNSINVRSAAIVGKMMARISSKIDQIL